VAVQFLMMIPAEWYGKFVADLPAKGAGLGKFEMVGIAGRSSRHLDQGRR
jgi:hypothetical protein